MSNEQLNTQLMRIYNTGTRIGLQEALAKMRTYLDTDETDPCDLTSSTLDKLRHTTDAVYESLDFAICF